MAVPADDVLPLRPRSRPRPASQTRSGASSVRQPADAFRAAATSSTSPVSPSVFTTRRRSRGCPRDWRPSAGARWPSRPCNACRRRVGAASGARHLREEDASVAPASSAAAPTPRATRRRLVLQQQRARVGGRAPPAKSAHSTSTLGRTTARRVYPIASAPCCRRAGRAAAAAAAPAVHLGHANDGAGVLAPRAAHRREAAHVALALERGTRRRDELLRRGGRVAAGDRHVARRHVHADAHRRAAGVAQQFRRCRAPCRRCRPPARGHLGAVGVEREPGRAQQTPVRLARPRTCRGAAEEDHRRRRFRAGVSCGPSRPRLGSPPRRRRWRACHPLLLRRPHRRRPPPAPRAPRAVCAGRRRVAAATAATATANVLARARRRPSSPTCSAATTRVARGGAARPPREAGVRGNRGGGVARQRHLRDTADSRRRLPFELRGVQRAEFGRMIGRPSSCRM